MSLPEPTDEPTRAGGRGMDPVVARRIACGPYEAYRSYVLRIARARGKAGAIARVVKLADLDDHISHGRPTPGAPPYAWGRQRILEHMEVRVSTALAG